MDRIEEKVKQEIRRHAEINDGEIRRPKSQMEKLKGKRGRFSRKNMTEANKETSKLHVQFPE